MMTAKRRPTIGDRCWEAEWLREYGIDPETGENDRDADKYVRRNFASREDAIAYAKTVLPQALEPFVMVTEMEFVAYDEADAGSCPHVGFWEAAADSECYEGEP